MYNEFLASSLGDDVAIVSMRIRWAPGKLAPICLYWFVNVRISYQTYLEPNLEL